ncbi:MAG: rhodanese-like domain-containing protein [Chitinophagaceae bacterium]|nr:rhodanese-like domain-containing protein [Chitinophagaceae bacterium]
MKSISAMDLFQIIQRKEGCLLIDVREVFEHYNFNIGGDNIPMSEIFENIQRLSPDQPIIMYCQKGIRSAIVIQRLEEKFGFTNLINLSGGVDAWRKDIKD